MTSQLYRWSHLVPILLLLLVVAMSDVVTPTSVVTHVPLQNVNETFNSTGPHQGCQPPDHETSGVHEKPLATSYSLFNSKFHHVSQPLLITCWILLASIAKIGFHLNHRMSTMFPESCVFIVLGLLLGLVLYFTEIKGYTLRSETFFLYLLPPIILDSGYFMPYRLFFDNAGSILLFAIIGTLFNTISIGASIWLASYVGLFSLKAIPLLHCFVFASLLSAVDPVAVLVVFEEIHVNEVLHIVLFGESLLNDGVSVVLYNMFVTYSEIGLDSITIYDIINGVGSFIIVGIGAPLIGVSYGIIAGFISRFTDSVRVIEPLLVFGIGYMSYLTGEACSVSGILACTFCGMTMRQYVESNVSAKSRTTIKYFMKMLASVCETIIFMFLGMSTVVDSHVWDTVFIFVIILFCLVYRSIGVVCLSSMVNRYRLNPISRVDQFIMAYGGLRGAIAFSLVITLNSDVFLLKNNFQTTTIALVYFTTFVLGSTIKPLVNVLKVKKAGNRKPTMNEQLHTRMVDHLMAGIEDVTGRVGHNEIREKFQKISNQYLKPCLLKKGHSGPGESLMKVYTQLTKAEMQDLARTASYNVIAQSLGQSVTSHGDSTIVEMKSASAAQDSVRMRDDCEIQHCLEDVMLHTRRTFHLQSHQMLPSSESVSEMSHMSKHNVTRHARAISHPSYDQTDAHHRSNSNKNAVDRKKRRRKIVSDIPQLSVNNGSTDNNGYNGTNGYNGVGSSSLKVEEASRKKNLFSKVVKKNISAATSLEPVDEHHKEPVMFSLGNNYIDTESESEDEIEPACSSLPWKRNFAGLETSGDTPERSRRGHQNEIEEAAVQRDMEAFGPTWVKLKPDDIEEVSRL